MIIYNTTYHIEDDIHDDYIAFVKDELIPRALKSGHLSNPQLALVHSQHEESGVSYALQFRVEDLVKLEEWMLVYGQSIRADIAKRFGEKALGFMTLLEEVSL